MCKDLAIQQEEGNFCDSDFVYYRRSERCFDFVIDRPRRIIRLFYLLRRRADAVLCAGPREQVSVGAGGIRKAPRWQPRGRDTQYFTGCVLRKL